MDVFIEYRDSIESQEARFQNTHADTTSSADSYKFSVAMVSSDAGPPAARRHTCIGSLQKRGSGIMRVPAASKQVSCRPGLGRTRCKMGQSHGSSRELSTPAGERGNRHPSGPTGCTQTADTK